MRFWSPIGAREARKSVETSGAARLRWPFDRFATIGAALLIAIALGDALAISMLRDASIAAYKTAMTKLARGMSAQTAHSLMKIDKILNDYATAAASPSGDGAAAALLDSSRTMAELASFDVADASGRIVVATPGGWPKGADVSTSEMFASLRTRGSRTPLIQSGEDGFTLSRRLVDPDGNFAGIAVAKVSVKALRDFYAIALPTGRSLTLMTDGGAVLVQFPRPQGSIAFAAHAERLGIDKGTCSVGFGPDLLDNAINVAGLCRFKDLPLALQTSVTTQEALAFWDQERIWLIVGGLLAALLVVWLLHVFARQVRRLERSELSLAEKKQQAEAAHRQLDVALSNIGQGVCFFDAHRRLIVANSRFQDLYGLPDGVAVPGAQLSDIVEAICEHGGLAYLHRERFVASFELVARARRPHASVFELGDGRTIAVQSQILADGGWVGTHEDITERRKAEEKISYLARHDVLTGLVNRGVVMERLEKLSDGAVRNGRFALLFMDLDRFKAVNDTLGHDIGDALLKLVAERLKRTAPAQSTIARFGGDEFVILATGVVDAQEIAALARNLIEAVSAPYTIKHHEIEIGASVGIEISSDEISNPDVLLKNADIALYRSKSQGRGTYRFFDAEGASDAILGRQVTPSRSVASGA